MKKIFSIIFAAAIFSGCASGNSFKFIQPNKIEFNQPPVGQIVSASIGEELLRQGVRYTQEIAVVEKVIKPKSNIHIHPGSYPKAGENDDLEFFAWNPIRGGSDGGLITINDSPNTMIRGFAISRKDQAVCTVETEYYFTSYCTNEYELKRRIVDVVDATAFQQTLLYNGRVGNKINIGYRETFSDRARQAFSNNVEYDLSDSKIISYRDAQIEVIEATNQKITYRVVRNFSRLKQ
jgi:hypothetical protein